MKQSRIGRTWWMGLLQSLLIGGLIGVVFPEVLHRIWWDRHPGSQAQFRGAFEWYLLGALVLLFAMYLVKFYVCEYWQLFARAPK